MSTDERINERTLATWTQTEIDMVLAAAAARRDEARTAGDNAEAAKHEKWINRLLDARPYHRSK